MFKNNFKMECLKNGKITPHRNVMRYGDKKSFRSKTICAVEFKLAVDLLLKHSVYIFFELEVKIVENVDGGVSTKQARTLVLYILYHVIYIHILY